MRLYRWLLRSAWTNGLRAGRVVEAEQLRAYVADALTSGRYDYSTSADALRGVLTYLDRRMEEVRHERAAKLPDHPRQA